MADLDTKLTPEETASITLAMVAGIEAKVDFLMLAHVKQRAAETGLSEDDQMKVVEDVLQKRATASLAAKLDALRAGRKPYTGF